MNAVLNLRRLLFHPLSNCVSPGATEMLRSTVVYVDHLYLIFFPRRTMLKFQGYSRNVA